jgi:hypothetical protein
MQRRVSPPPPGQTHGDLPISTEHARSLIASPTADLSSRRAPASLVPANSVVAQRSSTSRVRVMTWASPELVAAGALQTTQLHGRPRLQAFAACAESEACQRSLLGPYVGPGRRRPTLEIIVYSRLARAVDSSKPPGRSYLRCRPLRSPRPADSLPGLLSGWLSGFTWPQSQTHADVKPRRRPRVLKPRAATRYS